MDLLGEVRGRARVQEKYGLKVQSGEIVTCLF